METSGNGSDSYTNSTQENTSTSGGGGGNNQRLGFGRMQLSALNFFRSPLSFLLDYSGILPPATNHRETEPLIAVNGGAASPDSRPQSPGPCVETVFGGTSSGEVSIQIIGGGEQEGGGHSVPSQGQQAGEASLDRNGESVGGMPVSENQSSGGRSDNGAAAAMAGGRVPSPPAGSGRVDSVGVRSSGDDNSRDSYPRNDIQQFAKWTEQVLPFSLLLLVVFIRQHLQGTAFVLSLSPFVSFSINLYA